MQKKKKTDQVNMKLLFFSVTYKEPKLNFW